MVKNEKTKKMNASRKPCKVQPSKVKKSALTQLKSMGTTFKSSCFPSQGNNLAKKPAKEEPATKVEFWFFTTKFYWHFFVALIDYYQIDFFHVLLYKGPLQITTFKSTFRKNGVMDMTNMPEPGQNSPYTTFPYIFFIHISRFGRFIKK